MVTGSLALRMVPKKFFCFKKLAAFSPIAVFGRNIRLIGDGKVSVSGWNISWLNIIRMYSGQLGLLGLSHVSLILHTFGE